MSLFRSPAARALPAAFALLLLGGLPAAAGTATIASGDGDTMTFEYRGGELLRVGGAEDASYMLVRDNTLYVVSFDDGEAMVINASSMMKGFSGMLQQAAPPATTAEFVSLEKTGRSETVAGIKGEVYLLTTNEDGEERTQEVVMSDDKRAIEFRDALFMMGRAAMEAFDDYQLPEDDKDVQKQLEAMNLGVLRVGEDMTVTSLSGDSIATARFELPAEPMDMQGLGAMMGAMGQSSGEEAANDGKSGGLFSGMMDAFGGKADRQADRTEQKVDDKVDRETDSAVDKAVDKVFGKLFGD
ncbi:hypothetical protein [Pseudohaliea rubra]|uniref:DUF4412 domain-containing protein n=1 Tax=Pseudohaliea rubra DSM 19751 TaxID=1265313 RepID=A0A095VTI8_9GAMM|nr:hypothetical protein [Pseudohaliea rubra]KGE04403.1 hypothetical protein HRUBRA_00987 [Pseudohaliea rubra DSM 19751]